MSRNRSGGANLGDDFPRIVVDPLSSDDDSLRNRLVNLLTSTRNPSVDQIIAAVNFGRAEDQKYVLKSNAFRSAADRLTVFKQFKSDQIVKSQKQRVTAGLWSNGSGSLTAFYTSSQQSSSLGQYYYDIYQEDPNGPEDDLAELQFSIAYGHVSGGGAPNLSADDQSELPTRAIYSQYRNILIDPGDSKFTFKGADSDDAFFISIKRSNIKERMDPGNWELELSGSSGESQFIDDSLDKFDTNTGAAGRVYAIVSGTLNAGTEDPAEVARATASNGEGYGLFYPDVGVFVLNPSAINDAIGSFSPTTNQDAYYDNNKILFDALNLGEDFQARSAEHVTSTHYFVHAKNKEFNFSNNPSFALGENGALTNQDFEGDPKTYITTVGLYNENNELLATAKLARPLLKTFDREALVKVKLDY